MKLLLLALLWHAFQEPTGRVLLWAEGLAAAPVVRITGGAGGLGGCTDDGTGSQRCTAWCQCTAVEVDGVTVAGRWQLWLPAVGR